MTHVEAVSSGSGYFKYMQQEAEIGEWLGRGAERLGLAGEVSAREFRELRFGVDPKSGEALRKNQEDRVYQKPWGEKVYKAREFYEVSISAPKSVSLQGVVDPGVVEAHNKAVTRVLKDLEEVTQGELVMAAWQHRMSRTGDPQLHTHVAVMNVQHDEKEWHGLRAYSAFVNQRPLTETYRKVLLGEIQHLGYQIEYPEIRGISEELRDKYSQRSEQIYQKMGELPETPSYKEVQVAAHQTAQQKVYRTAREIMAEQYAHFEPGERQVLETLKEEARQRQALYVAPNITNRFQENQPVEKQVPLKVPRLQQEANFDPAMKKYKWDYGEEKKQGHGQHL